MTVLSVLSIDETTSRVKLNAENFLYVLEKANDHPLAIISIVGKLREGKSYALNHFIRYLRNGGKDAWEEVAVILLDCQGFYDMTLDTEKSAAIFALGSLLSSVLIYNITTKLDMEVLEKVQEFSKYAALVSSTTDAHVSAKTVLTILVRDFKWIKHFSLGLHIIKQPAANVDNPGNYFHHIFPISDAAGDENANLKALQRCFNDIGIFLMPHPGHAFLGAPDSHKPVLEFRNRLRGNGGIHVESSCDEAAGIRAAKALDAFKSEFVQISERTLFSEEDFENKYQPSYNVALQVYNANKSLETKDEVLYIENLQLKCRVYFETRVVENRKKIDKRAAGLSLNAFKEEFAKITEPFCEEEFEAKFYSSWEVAVKIYNSEKSSKSEDEDMCLQNLNKECRSYFEKSCVDGKRRKLNKRAAELALNAFKKKFGKITKSFRESIFENKFYTFWKAAEKTFNSEKSSKIEDEDAYLLNLKKECRKYLEETCLVKNKSRRNERAVNLAIKTFFQRFDRMFGLVESNQEKIQDVTDLSGSYTRVVSNSSAPPQRSSFPRLFKTLENMVWSEQDGLKEKEFDKMLTKELEDATAVSKINAIIFNDDEFKKLSKRVENECTLRFYKQYKPINKDRRKRFNRAIILRILKIAVAGVASAIAIFDSIVELAIIRSSITITARRKNSMNVVTAVTTDESEIPRLENSDQIDSLDGALPELTFIRTKVSQLFREIGLEFDDKLDEGLQRWYTEKTNQLEKNKQPQKRGAFPEPTHIMTRISELFRQRCMEFDEEMNVEFQRLYPERQINFD
ncbi:unnamed protein product [Allacma fusca]|uniref:Guanylate-binding protein N-terminal domain-containing protein n=1 Tax=Allacma fusca TaxID=39272 RepID=A0A8J2M291_9HEXA|nr:unnamed protein product [Allacma fusca]